MLSILGVILIVAFFGCLSMGIPEPKNETDTLVVVPMLRLTTRLNVFNGNVAYQLNLEHTTTHNIYSIDIDVRSAYGYRFISKLPPGEYIIKEYVPLGLVNAKVTPLSCKRTLIVEEGKIYVLPVKVVVMIFTYDASGE
jgi:hypothetical protein